MITPPKFPGRERILVPEGVHQAVLYDVWDIGFQKTSWQGQEKVVPQVILAFEIDKIIPSGNFQGKRYTVSKKYTFSLGEKANLARDLEAWRLKKLTNVERNSLDLETLIGKNCFIGITHETKDGKTYARISSISPIVSGMSTIAPENPRKMPPWVEKLKGEAVSMTESSDVREQEAQSAAEEPMPSAPEEETEIPF